MGNSDLESRVTGVTKRNIVSTYLKLNDGIPSLFNDNVIRSRANQRQKNTGGLFSVSIDYRTQV